MKNKKTIIIIIAVIVAVAIAGAVIAIVINKNKTDKNEINEVTLKDTNIEWVKEDQEGTFINVSSKITGEKKLGNLTLEEAKLESKDNKTDFIIKVRNDSEEDVNTKLITVTLLDKEENEILKLNVVINETKAGEETTTYISSPMNYTEAYSYKIEEN